MKKKRIVLYKVRLEEDKQLRNHWTGVNVEEAKQIAEIVEPVFRGLDREQIVVLYFDTKMKPIGMEIVAIGGTKACIVETSNIFKGAIAARVPLSRPAAGGESCKQDSFSSEPGK
ncbi:JAB domain-containing protein [Ventrimonas sp. CLA-AP-H27]|uniref:JAB domain-containing protein n=1 Tax=Ventrimonas faecis TaxID=3133170 RepID=A0ABV1HIT4_9FIRM